MKNRLFTLLFIFIRCVSYHSQNHAFVLVDVSKSISKENIIKAKEDIQQVLMGNNPTYAAPQQQYNPSIFKLNQGDILYITSFGDADRTCRISFYPHQIQNIPQDITNTINSIQWIPQDLATYLTLAKAKVAEYAKTNNIKSYKLYIISDNINDYYGTPNKPYYPTTECQILEQNYNTTTNPILENPWIKIKVQGLLFISMCEKVDISKYTIPTTGASTPTSTITSQSVYITSPPSSYKDKDNPYFINKRSQFTLSWKCDNCPQNTSYKIIVSPIGRKSSSNKTKVFTTNNNSYTIPPLQDGLYKITISSILSSDFIYLKVDTSSWWWIIILLIIVIIILWIIWNRKREKIAQGEIKDKNN